jgi:phosphodiesterase/alkaline phosphatase D-like protein
MNAMIHAEFRGILRNSFYPFHKVRCNESVRLCLLVASFQKRAVTSIEENAGNYSMTKNDQQWILPQVKSLPKRICFGSCSSQYDGDLSYWDRIVEAEPDLVLLMGDNVYAPPKTFLPEDDSLGAQELPTNANPNSESSHRVGRSKMHASYHTLAADPSFRRAARKIPFLPTLDDNDYNWRNLDATVMTEDEINHEMEAAKQEFLQFFQIPTSDARWQVGRGVYTRYDFYLHREGTNDTWCSSSNEPNRVSKEDIAWRLQIILLDVRRHKSPFAKRPLQTFEDTEDICVGPYIPDCGVNNTMLGAAQWQWLEDQLTEVPNLRLLVSPIQVLSDGQHGWDCWSLFPRERQRLLSMLRCENKNTIPTLLCRVTDMSRDFIRKRLLGVIWWK